MFGNILLQEVLISDLSDSFREKTELLASPAKENFCFSTTKNLSHKNLAMSIHSSWYESLKMVKAREKCL